MASEQGQLALQMIDKLLAQKPEKSGHDFSAATRCLAAFRDELVALWRDSHDQADRTRLAQANAVLSVVVGGHFPRGDIPWQEIEQARSQLARLVR